MSRVFWVRWFAAALALLPAAGGAVHAQSLRRMPAMRAAPVPAAAPAANLLQQSILGGKMPLSALPPLPLKRDDTTAGSLRRRFSLANTTIDYATGTGCGSTVGAVFNAGCQLQFRLYDTNPAGSAHTFQDYFIDAAASTAQTVGTTYTLSANYGPYHAVTLANPGVYVLASYDTVNASWAAVMYVQVGSSAASIGTYADSAHLFPATAFTIPSSGTSNVYIAANNVSKTDSYVVYVENTTNAASCAYMAPPLALPAGSNKGLCDPGAESSYISSPSGSLAVTWPIGGSATPGSYSIVLWDQTTKQRLGQQQIVLEGTAGANAPAKLTPAGGNPSPAPAPAATPGTVFAYNNASDQSDKSLTATFSGVTSGHQLCLNVQDPSAHTFVSNGILCQTPSSGTASFTYAFAGTNAPFDYLNNVYTLGALDTVTDTVVGVATFKLLGYNVLTQFTNAAGSTVTGSAQVLPKNSSTTGGLLFTNDADSYYGSGNGDAIAAIEFNTNGNGDTVQLPCAPCTAETVADSNGNSWNVKLTATGSGSHSGSIVDVTPVTAGVTLPMNASISLPNLTFANQFGNANCTSTCAAYTSILPADGLTWSAFGSTAAANLVYFTNNAGNTYAGTASFVHLGITNPGTAYSGGSTAGEEDHGYYPRFANAIYAAGQPFASAASYADVYAMTVTNTSSSGNIKGIAITYPTQFGTAVKASIDAASPTAWQSTACPAGYPASGVFCIATAGSNAGVAPSSSQSIYVDLQGLPSSSFTYTDFTIQADSPTAFNLTAAAQTTPFVDGGTPASVDSTAVAAFSLDSSLITAAFAPTSEGTGTNNPVQISVQNAAAGSDPNPDYLDAIVVELPTGVVASPPAWSGLAPATWSYLGSSTGLAAGTTDYWFGICPSQMNAADGPVQNPPPVKPALPSCGSAAEQNSLAPGAQFTATANFNVGTSASTIQATMYAHGANGGGWSKGSTFDLSVTPIAASAGFINAGTYGAPPAVPSNTEPQVAADTDPTYGNSFVYQIHNSSSSGNTITSAVITIPGTDNSGANGADSSGVNWTITAAPALSGSGWSHCAVTSYTSAGSNGSSGKIVIGNDSGGTCAITPGGSLDVTFPMKGPYKVNAEYQFPTVVNGTIAASENWLGDTYLKIVLSGNLVIFVWPSGTGPGGSNPVPACTLACTYNQTTGTIDLGSIPNGSSNTGTDVVTVSVYTDASAPAGWKLYVSTNNNPANTAGPSNELLTGVDSGASTSGAGLNFDQTAFGVVPTSAPGSLLVDTGAGTSARRLPFDVVNNFQVTINGGSVAPQTSVVTYTFIAN